MSDYQDFAFHWATGQTLLTGVVIIGIGLLFALQGFRFARPLFALTSAVAGFVLGLVLGETLKVPSFPISAGLAGVLGAAGLVRFRLGIVIASTLVFSLLAQYLTSRFSSNPSNLLFALVFGAALGLSLRWVCMRSLPIIVSVLQGAALMVIGFVGVADNLAPSLANTFTDWARTIPLMIPVLMTMLFVLGYSVQANQQQGDMQTGASRGWNNLEMN
jgi:hypothetical protein